ncbi:MAG: elongation factor P [Candidatus Magasanikbacteria bacterium CG1_02_32_51]|uniref:Elongation factor P n=1 Tax=Candidatus Magasanikbacteria bacterium CG1_02_32_51 TaxID=1805238 RepID=A0A1J4U614_9BACT|nr:MAG: elongation factor P [Candidatus Magasanikbacteria bacterium CG1_02_32_51]
MGDTTDIKKGAVIRHNGQLFVINTFQFVNPGKGQAFFKCKLKSIDGVKGMELTYKSGETIDSVEVQNTNMQYLYKTGSIYSFMNQSTYETVDVSVDIIGDDGKYLKEGLDIVASTHDGNIVAIQLPKKITYKVVTAPPAVKGDSSGGNVTKEIVLDNGLIVYAPIFIKEGEEILVNTETGEYGGRVV